MTIAISIKVHDGIVLASDSATAMFAKDPQGNTAVINIYNCANKIFNLHKGIPVGAITWGSGSIGNASISTLTKDFRARITNKEKYKLDPNNYKVEDIFNKFIDFMYTEHYAPFFGDWKDKPDLGFMVCGYSSKEPFAEEYRAIIQKGELIERRCIRTKEQTGLTWNGQPEAITRLYFGVSNNSVQALKASGFNQDEADKIMKILQSGGQIPMVMPAMPIQDAIELARFLVDTTINFSKYAPGATTVGGPIEIAAITKYEHFKWVSRKHYYEIIKNPKMEGV